jgi:L-iditol 2-dehydrogenase
MKAMQLSAYKQLDIVDIPEPSVDAHDILVQVKACGICGSDVHGWDGSTGRRQPPIVMGHEASGIVAKVGKSVTKFEIGDRVTFDSTVSCGKCDSCRAARINLCTERQVLGVSCDEFRRNGAFAEFVVVPENIVYALPEEVSFEHAALIESVSIAVHAANRSQVRLGDTAIVIGSGMIGLLVVQAIRRAGATRVIAVDLDAKKLAVAQSLGATDIIDASQSDVVEKVMAMTDGRGADVAIEVVGTTKTVQDAIEATRRGGTVTLVGNLSPTVEMPLQKIVNRELDVRGSCASNGEYPECIALMRDGSIKVEPLISKKISLAEGPAWFEKLYSGTSEAMKVIIQPS